MATKKCKRRDAPSASRTRVPVKPPTIPTMGIEFSEPSHMDRYEKLRTRRVQPTKFFCKEAIDALGITEDVKTLFETISWIEFLDKHPLTYESLTLEFLSSLEKHVTTDDDGEENIKLSFQIFNTSHTLTLEELNQAFNWDPYGTITPDNFNFDNYDQKKFWEDITGEKKYVSSCARATSIVSPVLRYAHRMLSSIFFSRKDEGIVNSTELRMLWMLTQDADEVGMLNCGEWLLKRLIQIRDGDGITGNICIGGIVTLLAEHLGHDCTNLVAVSPNVYIDLQSLKNMDHIREAKGKYIWRVREKDYATLPNAALTSIEDEDCWMFPSEFPVPASPPPQLNDNMPPPDNAIENSMGPRVDLSEHNGCDLSSRLRTLETSFATLQMHVAESLDAFHRSQEEMRRMIHAMYHRGVATGEYPKIAPDIPPPQMKWSIWSDDEHATTF